MKFVLCREQKKFLQKLKLSLGRTKSNGRRKVILLWKEPYHKQIFKAEVIVKFFIFLGLIAYSSLSLSSNSEGSMVTKSSFQVSSRSTSDWIEMDKICVGHVSGWCNSDDAYKRCQEISQALLMISNDKAIIEASCAIGTFEQCPSCGFNAQLLTVRLKVFPGH